MWLPLVYLFVITKIISALLVNEPKDLLHIFIENLKQDPLLLDDYDGVSQKSKRFIEHKVEKFVGLLSQSQQSGRSKRSLDEKNANNFINIFPKNILSIENADDIRLFHHQENYWFAVSLENQTNLTIYHYKNETFNKFLHYETLYTTNLAVLPTDDLPLIIVGVNDFIKVLEFNFKTKTIEVLQTIKTSQPKHVVVWEQEGAYLSITETALTKSNIKIYKWLGRHFDHVQDIPVENIRKTVPFNIHGSTFLASVDNQQESKSYSEIYKFNIHSMQFELFQRLLTNGCTDIKFFTSKMSGENHYFLVVVHSTNEESVSVTYKYEDNYFIPFQTLKTVAIEWQPIEDLKGNTALISISKNSLKGFQYNQWHFVETDIITAKNDVLFSNFAGLRTIHTYNFNGEQILVVACDHCHDATNVFKVNFTNFNAIKDLYSQISTWCTNTLKEFEEPELIVSRTLRGDLNEQISEEEDQKRQVLAALSQSKETLFKIEQTLLPSEEELVFEEDFEADNLIFNNSATFNSLEAASINALNVDNLFANVLNIEKGFTLEDPMEFQVLSVNNSIEPEIIINNVPLEQYIRLNSNATIEQLTVNGSITFRQNLNVNNSINNIKISNKTLLLQSGNQIFAGNLTLTDLKAENLNTNQISKLKTLKVKELAIGGYLNRVSIPVLVKRALKKSGNQTMEKPFSCDALEVDSFNVGGDISGKKVPNDFVLINSGEYIVSQDVEFLKDLKTNKFEVLSSLNNISVTDEGALDVLLSESPYVQYMPTRKTFENIIITNPINLRYKIRNAKMEQYNPVIIDGNSYKINKDVTINGLGEVTRWLRAQDLKPKESPQRSFGAILDKGLKLSDTQIPVHLNFTQPLNLNDVIADKVNSLNPLEWLLKSSNATQIVKGQKTFLGNVHLNGQLNASRINDVDVHALKREALRVAGDQEIFGDWKVNRVVAEKGISTNRSSNLTMEDIIVLNQTLTLDHLNITNLQIKGTINGKNMSNVLRNFVKKDAIIHKVFGEKTFDQLHVEDLIIKDTNLLRLLNDVLINEITLNKSLDLPNDVKVDKLMFEESIKNLSKQNFDELMNLTNSDDDDIVIIASDMEYDEITVIGDVSINDNAINGKNLSAIEEATVKVDEDHEFESGIIDGTTFVDKFLNLSGNIENLDLNTIVEQNAKQLLKIEDKIFQNHLHVNGTLSINKKVNGMELKKFCTFSEPNEQLKTLKIKGDVLFSKGPKIINFNGESMKSVMKNVWFSDVAANISASVHLQNVTFNKSVNVSAFVDTINLDLLSENYLSKSKKQIIRSSIAFSNVTFSNISTPTLKYKGPINGIIIEDILKSVLIQGEPQIFESTGYFEEVEVQNLIEDTEYTVNNLSLNTDIMRYDQQNIVTGPKTFENLRVVTLNLTHNVKIQKVDILDWLSNAVLTKGVIRVKEKKSFYRATFNQGLSLRGKFNGEDFTEENIMLVNMPQNITGKKVFFKSTQFKTLMVKGLVNNVDIDKLVQNQTNRHENSTIDSEIIFDNDVEAKNINVDILYDNINVTQLIANVTKLRNLDHLKGKFKDLLNMGMEIEGSLKNHATLFKYYKEIIQFTDIDDIFGLKCEDGIFRLVVFCMASNQFKTFEFDAEMGTFVFTGVIFKSPSKPNFMQQVTLGDRAYLYIENPLQNHNDLHAGRLIKLLNPTTFEIVAEFHRTATISLISFVNLASQGCLGFIGNSLSGIDILCDENGYNYYWSQRIGLEGAYKATTLETPDFVYLFVTRYEQAFKEPSIVIFQSGKDTTDFIEIQTIFERTSPNGLATAFISNSPYVALSFGSQEKTVDSGWISIKKLDNNQFIEWQHIPLTTPQNVHFINQPSFEPLLLVPSADVSAPLHTFRYDGAAGFKEISKGSSLPVSSEIKILGNGHFLATLQHTRSTGSILGAVVL